MLERIQRRATKLCPKLRKKTYEERLARFRITSLRTRRERGDLIEFYKIVHGLEEINWVNEIKRLDTDNHKRPTLRRLRDHFYRESRACMVREKFFINRVIPLWNELTAGVRDAPSLDSHQILCKRLSWLKLRSNP